MVDAGLCWDTATAIRRAQQFEPFNLTWLEEPLHPDNLQGYARLSAQSPVRIAAGEEICDIKEFQQMMDVGGIDVVQVDVTRASADWPASKRIGWDSAERHRLCVNHSYKTGVNIAASPALRRRPAEHALLRVLRRAGGAAANLDEAAFPRPRRRHSRAGGTGTWRRIG